MNDILDKLNQASQKLMELEFKSTFCEVETEDLVEIRKLVEECIRRI